MPGEDDSKVLPLPATPGIKRDGTPLEDDHWSDGTWVRFNNRGMPRKIGGFKLLNEDMPEVSRGIQVAARDLNAFVHSGMPSHVHGITLDSYTGEVSGGPYDRTPAGLPADVRNLWTFEQMYNPGGSNSVLIGHVAPNGLDIASSGTGNVYYDDAYGTGTLLPVTVDSHDSGGIVALAPFLFSFGNYGTLHWSSAGDPLDLSVSSARITEQKIVAGMNARAGATTAPAGLFWSLNAVLRATFIGGSAQFQFDLLSDNSTMFASRSVASLDGVPYWISNGRFLRYSGVVQEAANNLNVDDFFANVNRKYRQRIWACPMPAWGEIWWFYPRGTSQECNWAIVHCVRLSQLVGKPVWFDTPIPNGHIRTAGHPAGVFPFPIMAGAPLSIGTPDKFTVYQHEVGYDALLRLPYPISSSITSGNLSVAIGGSDANVALLRVEPDMRQVGRMTLTRLARPYARGLDSIETVEVSDLTTVIDDLRGQGRLLRLKFATDVTGGFFELGRTLVHVGPGDKRPVDD